MSSRVKRSLTHIAAATAFVIGAASTANAATVAADLTKVGGNTWDASFTVEAGLGQTVEAFSIYFDWAQVSNLMVWASPADWDSLAVPQDAALMSDGYFDALALAAGISNPKALGGFIARFDWVDAAGPAMLRYTINDPLTFDELESGTAALSLGGGVVTSVPEPSTSLLLSLAFCVAALGRRGRASRQMLCKCGSDGRGTHSTTCARTPSEKV